MSDTPSTDAPRVPLPAGRPGPLAPTAGPDPVSWPAPSIMGLPPLALGGMGGGALTQNRVSMPLQMLTTIYLFYF